MAKLDEALEIRTARGANCSQTVLCTYAKELGLEFETAWKLTEGQGGGFGGRRGLCGAVNAMAMVLSGLVSENSEYKGRNKKAVYALVNRATEMFNEKNGSEICRILKSEGKHNCTDLILDCVNIIEQIRSEGTL